MQKRLTDPDFRQEVEAKAALFAAGLNEIASRRSIIGEIRVAGLLGCVELVRDRSSREPARDALGRLVADLLRRGVLALPGGLYENTLMLIPPLTIRKEQVNHGLALLDESLATL